jgi:restriction endonuclease S subunit
VVERCKLVGREIKTRPQFCARAGNLIMSRIDARNGAFGIIPHELDGALVTQDFPMFRIEPSVVLPEYLALVLKSEEFTEICRRSSRGTTNRKRLREDLLLAEDIRSTRAGSATAA